MDDSERMIVNYFNGIYSKGGFEAVIDKVEEKLELGEVTKKDTGLYCITTVGWSEDEFLIDALISFLSFFRNHYVGFLCGGAYYFVEDKSGVDSVEICYKRSILKKEGMIK